MNNKKDNINPNLQVLVSNQLIGPEGVTVGFAFRSKAADPQDSGWNFWSGEETEEYVNDPDNFTRYPLRHFLELDESLLEILDAEIGTTWERDEDTDGWIEAGEED